MTKYFIEIQNRLILLYITWFSIVLISYFYKETILFLVIKPSLNVNDSFETFYFIFTNALEVLSVYLKLIKFLSFQIFFIYFIYHIYIFLSPALFCSEYFYLRFNVQFVFCFLLLSIVLFTYILIPFIWNFFLSFQNLIIDKSFNLYFEAKLNEYLNFYISSYYLCEFYCQFFIFFLLILDYTKFNIKKIKKFRKFYYYCFIVFSTFISPPDIVSQIFFSLIFIFIYECLIFFSLLKN